MKLKINPKPNPPGICLIRAHKPDADKIRAAAAARRRSINQYLIDLALNDFEKLEKSGKIALTK